MKPTYDTPVEVAPGHFKRLGDCRKADLLAAADLSLSKLPPLWRIWVEAQTQHMRDGG